MHSWGSYGKVLFYILKFKVTGVLFCSFVFCHKGPCYKLEGLEQQLEERQSDPHETWPGPKTQVNL